ncbi:DUF2007 domain-containing protein [Flavobacteriales bacterium]|jgi:hypothetical protein|nr:DUF2007 domain-containing protein [Flavobacteriales bacterium]
MEGWTLIHSDSVPFGAEVYRTRLEAAGIKVVVLNKQDSSYGMFGSVEVYVPNEDLQRSKEVLSVSEDGETSA